MMIKIKEIIDISDYAGKKGPLKLIKFFEDRNGSKGRQISGFVFPDSFKEHEWVNGSSHDVEVTQNGKYFNFRLVSNGNGEKNKSVNTYNQSNEKLEQIEKKLDRILEILSSSSNPKKELENSSLPSAEDDVPF